MPIAKLKIKPGFDSQSTQTANEAGWFDGNLLRWRMGLLEKLAGWVRLFQTALGGRARSMNAWSDLDNISYLEIGSDAGPYIFSEGALYPGLLLDVRETAGGFATDGAFSVSIGSPVVTVRTDIPVSAGDVITFRLPLSLGNRLIAANTSFPAATSWNGTSFTFNMPLNALINETNVPGVPLIGLDSIDPNYGIANVFIKAHGKVVGDTFHFDQDTRIIIPGYATAIFPPGTDVKVIAVASPDSFQFNFIPYLNVDIPHNIGQGSGYEGENQNQGSHGILFYRSRTVATQTDWFTDNFGSVGLMVYSNSPLWAFTPPIQMDTPLFIGVSTGTFTITAPQLNVGMLVAMPQAQVILFGTQPIIGSGGTIDPLLLRWSDAGDYQVWTATVSNQAGSFRLSRGSKIVGAIQAPQTTLVFTDTDAWSMSYIGPPLVYGFTIMGRGCGLIAAHAVVSLGGVTYWMSREGFWQYAGGGVVPLPCNVRDYIFSDLDTDRLNKVHAGASTSTGEVYFFFPSMTDRIDYPATRNLLEFSQDFAQFAWSNFGILSVTGSFTAPNSTSTAQKLIEKATTEQHAKYEILVNKPVATTYTLSVYCHKDSTRNLWIGAAGPLGNNVIAFFNPVFGILISTQTNSPSGDSYVLISATSGTDSLATGLLGNGWLRYTIIFRTNHETTFYASVGNADATPQISYLGDGVKGVIVWGAQLELGNVLSDYQVIPRDPPDPNECTRFVKYNTVEGLWDTGKWPRQQVRTAWLDYNIYGPPLGGDLNNRIQQHERGFDDDGEPMGDVFAESGYADISQGENIAHVSKCIPDMKWFGVNGGVDVTFKGAMYPGGKISTAGPFSVTDDTQWFTPRMRARQVAVRLDWRRELNFSARVGAFRFSVNQAGKRP